MINYERKVYLSLYRIGACLAHDRNIVGMGALEGDEKVILFVDIMASSFLLYYQHPLQIYELTEI